ncbi:unnamed protein product [Cylicocyclus nassatus]|uniref:Apple domain-containing protein n=1 Tax=Cylicocyclus nassatus TaxID=53992 RepID=A0AA36H475_CYLNA|nr:unnamed protein product [Cylicocyclus nassatus]
MSPRYANDYTETHNAMVHPFASSSRGAVLDIAVPDEQRIYGRGEPAPLESRSVVYGVQNFRRSLNTLRAQKSKRRMETKDSAKELSISDSEASNLASASSLGYRPPPPTVRREIDILPRCSYDADKWALHMESTLTYAVMFDRRTGGSCRECLDRCTEKQGGVWTCRSVVYDSNWHICDLFAVVASAAPFTLVDYKGRDYFEYLAALPPSDDELSRMNDFARQQQIAIEKRYIEKCSNDPPKASDVKTEQVEKIYNAIPIEAQLEAEKRELEKKEKEQKRKERKLQKINKEKMLMTVSPPVIKSEVVLPVPDLEEIAMDLETLTTVTETEETTPATTEDPCREKTMETDISTEPTTAPTTTQSPASTKTIRRKPAGKTRTKKMQNKEKKLKESQVRLELNEEYKAATLYPGQSQRRRPQKIIRRRPARVFRTNQTLATTTEVIQDLTSELARRKIQLYQMRKAAEAKAKAPEVKMRRVRLEGQRLYGDVSGEDFDDPWSKEQAADEEEITVNEGDVTKSKTGKHRQKKVDERKPMKKGLSLRKLRKSGHTTIVTNAPSLTLEGTTSTVGLSPAALRAALSKEIRNFVSKELKHKYWRMHGTALLKGKEEVDAPSGLEPMVKKSKSAKKKKENLTSSVCNDKEKVVMMLFVNSTRKAYTPAVDIVKAQNQEDCLEFCERSLDCSSAVYSSHLCEMSATRARHTVPDIRPSAEDTYIEKACVASSVIRGRATHIIGAVNHILAGFVEQVEDAYSVEDCITACYDALKQHGFHCMSAMWYPLDKEQNCLLNGESRKTHPALFIPEVGFGYQFLETYTNHCEILG